MRNRLFYYLEEKEVLDKSDIMWYQSNFYRIKLIERWIPYNVRCIYTDFQETSMMTYKLIIKKQSGRID